MKISQIAFIVAFAGVLSVPVLSQARVTTIEKYIPIWQPNNFSRPVTSTEGSNTGACTELCQSVNKISSADNPCHKYVSSSEIRPGMDKACTCYTDNGNQTDGYSPSDGKVVDLNSLYTDLDCKATPGASKKVCVNGSETTRYATCNCGSRSLSMTEETYNNLKNIKFLDGDLGTDGKYYTDKSSGVKKYCFKTAPKCKQYKVSATGGFSSITEGNNILDNALGSTLGGAGLSGKASLTKKSGYYEFTLNITKAPVSDAGLFTKPFNGQALTYYNASNTLVGLYCMDYLDVGKSDEDYNNVFGNPAKVDMLSKRSADTNYINETNAYHNLSGNGNINLPWIKNNDRVVAIPYSYFSKCRSNGNYETFSTTGSISCGAGVSAVCKTNKGKFNSYDGKEWQQGYCCECGGCTNSYNTSTGILYATYSTTPAAFTKTGCEVKCNTDYIKVCVGGNTACDNTIYIANGKNKTEIAAVSGSITSGLAAQYTYNITTLVVNSGSTVYGRIACATPVGCNTAGGYVNNTCSADNWVTWFNNN